jgi:hypothetical protein
LKERGWSTLEISDIILVKISKGMHDSWWICKYIQVCPKSWSMVPSVMFQTLACFESLLWFQVLSCHVLKC